MNQITAAEVRQFIVAHYSDRLASKGATAKSLHDDFDLLQEGIIDSLGILEMVSAVEAKFGLDLDLEALNAEDLTKVGPFCQYVASFSERRLKGLV